LKPDEVDRFCGNSYQCKYDYAVTMNEDFGHWSKFYLSQYTKLVSDDLTPST